MFCLYTSFALCNDYMVKVIKKELRSVKVLLWLMSGPVVAHEDAKNTCV